MWGKFKGWKKSLKFELELRASHLLVFGAMIAIGAVCTYHFGVDEQSWTAAFTAIAAFGTWAAAIATVCAVIVAKKALSTWKEEHWKKAQYDVARRAIVAVHNVTKGFEKARTFMIPVEEKAWSLEEIASWTGDKASHGREIIDRFNNYILPPTAEFMAIESELKIVCDIDTSATWSAVSGLVSEYKTAMYFYINAINGRVNDNDGRQFTAANSVVFGDNNEHDRFNAKIQKTVTDTEGLLKIFLEFG